MSKPEQYKVIYRGGLADLPKAKVAAIELELTDDAFVLTPTSAAKKFWQPLTIPYANVADVTIVGRQVSTFEGLVGGLNSRQLNQDNNIHVDYTDEAGTQTLLRLEMLTGVTVMGQAKKATEFADRLRTLGIRDKFQGAAPAAGGTDVADQLRKLGELRDAGVLTAEEFDAKKTELLARM